LPNLKCLMLVKPQPPRTFEEFRALQHPRPPVPSLLLGELDKFKNLTSLLMDIQENIHQILAPIGNQLKELSLHDTINDPDRRMFVNVMKAIIVCPNLEHLHLRLFNGPVCLEEQVAPQNLKLKRLILEGDFCDAVGFLPILFRAPLLEEVDLWYFVFCKEEADMCINYLSERAMFQNVNNFKFKLCDEIQYMYRSAVMGDMEYFVRNIVSFCPRLERGYFNLFKRDDRLNYDFKKSPLAPFMDLVKLI